MNTGKAVVVLGVVGLVLGVVSGGGVTVMISSPTKTWTDPVKNLGKPIDVDHIIMSAMPHIYVSLFFVFYVKIG